MKERQEWTQFSAQHMAKACGENEPEYTAADCYSDEEIEVSNYLADRGPKTIVP